MKTSAVLKLIFLICGTVSLVSAQTPEAKTTLSAVALAKPVSGLFYRSGGKVLPFQANLGNPSLPLDYQGPRTIFFFTEESAFDPRPEGTPAPVPAASVTLPAAASRVLLVCVSAPDDSLRILPFDISSGTQKAGDYRFFNFSPLPVALILDGEKTTLAPRKDLIITKSAWRENVSDLPVQLAIPIDGAPRRAYSSAWGHRPGQRYFVFLSAGSPTRPLAISRFTDIPSNP